MKISVTVLGALLCSTASAVNLPVFIKFDPGNKVLESARQGGKRRTSKIEYFASTDDTIVLLGDDVNEGWSATVDKSTGSLTATVSEQGMGYIIFGSCLAL